MLNVQIFIPCYIDQFYPQTGMNMVKVLRALGCKVVYNSEQTCCGQPALNAGFKKYAEPIAKKFLNDFNTVDYIVTPSASCAGMVLNYYDSFFRNTSNHIKYRKIRNNMFEFSEFAVKILDLSKLKGTFNTRAVYHSSCSAMRETKTDSFAQDIIKGIEGLEILEMPLKDQCCGFGGTFSTEYEDVSIAILKEKVDLIMQLEVDYLISADSSCLMQFESYFKKHNISIKTLHLADVMAKTLDI